MKNSKPDKFIMKNISKERSQSIEFNTTNGSKNGIL